MSLKEHLDQLASFEPVAFPVISLYLNTEAGPNGRGQFEQFVRKEFPLRAKTYALRSPERESFDQDHERIKAYLETELQASINGLALFACSAANGFFDAIQLEAPIREHRLFVSNQPHLYPLARLHDQYRRYAAVLVDSHSARLFVFGFGKLLAKEEVTGTKTNRTAAGGWSQARYQRHIDNFHLQHCKEVVEVLDRLVKDEELDKIVLAGDEVIVPVFREQLPPHLSEKIVDVLRIDIKTPENEVFSATLEAMRQDDAKNDVEKVERLFNEFRSGGLGVVGAQDTLSALNNGQVDELILSAARKEIRSEEQDREEPPVGEGEQPPILADTLVTAAHQTSAKVTFIEDPTLLKEVGGVGALLRYRL
jgi:peptide chain release factor subunit 1